MLSTEELRNLRGDLRMEIHLTPRDVILSELLDDLIARREAALGIAYGTSGGAIDTSGMTGDGGTVSWPSS